MNRKRTDAKEKRIINLGCYLDLAEELRAYQADLEICTKACFSHAPYARFREAAVVLVNDGRRLINHLRLFSDTQEECDKRMEEMERRIKESESRPQWVFECGNCHRQFFADKSKAHWCDRCRRPLRGAARIGEAVENRKATQREVSRHNAALPVLSNRIMS